MSSERYIRYMRKSLKEDSHRERSCEHAEEAFIKNLAVPELMAVDLFRMIYNLNGQSLDDQVLGKLGTLIELFAEQYEDSESTLTREEWMGIRDIVSEYAQDLSDSLLNYTMGLVLEKKAI